MSNVDLSIGGRSFMVACAAGEEAHIAGLGRMIDAKLAAMGDVTGQSESRVLLFAALLLADELHDLRLKVQSPPSGDDAGVLGALDRLAERLEKLALDLEDEGEAA
jgi:cell division protein ZapA